MAFSNSFEVFDVFITYITTSLSTGIFE